MTWNETEFSLSCGGPLQKQRACTRNEGYLLHDPDSKGLTLDICTPYPTSILKCLHWSSLQTKQYNCYSCVLGLTVLGMCICNWKYFHTVLSVWMPSLVTSSWNLRTKQHMFISLTVSIYWGKKYYVFIIINPFFDCQFWNSPPFRLFWWVVQQDETVLCKIYTCLQGNKHFLLAPGVPSKFF